MAKSSGSSGGMLKGLSNKSPPASDSSMKLGKESVNSEATRSEASSPPTTIGPRCA
jgi:hypothetical protein